MYQKPDDVTDEEWAELEPLDFRNRETALSLLREAKKRQKIEVKKNPLQLCFWPEPKRGSPNSCLRSALFPAIQGKTRRALKREKIEAQSGYELIFTGWQLDQADFDVFLQSMHLARQHPLGNVCNFTGRGFLKAIGRAQGGHSLEWLKDAIHRLRGAVVEIKTPLKNWDTYNLLSKASGNELQDSYSFTIDPIIMKLFSPKDWTSLEWEQRRKLQRKSLALWLHGYYSSHSKPYPVKVETLCKLSGSSSRNFKIRLEQALKELASVSGWNFWIDENELIQCRKNKALSTAKSA